MSGTTQLDQSDGASSVKTLGGVGDSAKVVDTGAGAHTYGYSGGNLVTDLWTYNGRSYLKTFTYDTSGNLVGETDWVKQ